MNQDFYYFDETDYNKNEESPNSLKKGFAITSFVLSLINFFCCLCGYSFIFAPISIILAVISLATHRGGKAFAITGIVVSCISLVVFGLYFALFMKFYPDLQYFQQHDSEIISAYEENGEIPERFEKYRDSKYSNVWKAFDCNNFDEFFDYFVKQYKQRYYGESGGYNYSREESGTEPSQQYIRQFRPELLPERNSLK